MEIICPNCKQQIEQYSTPKRGHTGDGSQAWICLWCPVTICVCCYTDHISKKHPEKYDLNAKKK